MGCCHMYMLAWTCITCVTADGSVLNSVTLRRHSNSLCYPSVCWHVCITPVTWVSLNRLKNGPNGAISESLWECIYETGMLCYEFLYVHVYILDGNCNIYILACSVTMRVFTRLVFWRVWCMSTPESWCVNNVLWCSGICTFSHNVA